MLEGVANSVNGIHELGNAFEGEELALDRDEDGIGGNEGIESKEIEGGRAVDQDEVELVSNALNAFAKAEFTVGNIDQLEVGADEVLVR